VTTYDHLHQLGNAHHLAQHLIDRGADPERLLVTADRWIVQDLSSFRKRARCTVLLVAFEVDPELYRASNGYVIAEQGKPPDFVLEIASATTGQTDIGAERDDYEAFGIPEYWRFDETGEFHGARLAGDRLIAKRYQPIPVEALPNGGLLGYSGPLDLNLGWFAGRLGWHDPISGRHIATFEQELARADDEPTRADAERVRADAEHTAYLRSERRVRELQDELRQLRGE